MMGPNFEYKVTYSGGQFHTFAVPKFPLQPFPVPMIQHLINEAESLWEIPRGTIKGRSRKRQAVDPRHAVVYAAKRMTTRSYPEIGRIMGGFDHSTMIHAERRAAEKRKQDPDYRAMLVQLMWNVRNARRSA